MDLTTDKRKTDGPGLFEEKIERDKLFEKMNALTASGCGEKADNEAQKLFQQLADTGRVDDALTVLSWLSGVRGLVDNVRGLIETLFSGNRNALKLIDSAGFGTRTPILECFDRFNRLRSLKRGMFCYHKSWGFGVISEIDFFYQRLDIEFERKRDHEMSFCYAAEALETLDDEHILSIKHNNPSQFERMIRENPAEVVRITLRSYGSMSVARLAQRLIPSVLPETEWKKFWEGARKGLKNDTYVEIPKKRSENIVLHTKGQAYDEAWFRILNQECDTARLFERFKEIIEKKIDLSSDFAKKALANRLSFIINGAPSARPEWKAEGIVYIRNFNLNPSELDIANSINELIKGDLAATLERIPSRQLQKLLTLLLEHDRETMIGTLREVIQTGSYPVLSEVILVLIANDAEDEVHKIMAVAIARRTASAPMLLWCQRSPDYVKKWRLISLGNLAFRIQDTLENNDTSIVLRARNQLRECFQTKTWLHEAMETMNEQQRRDFTRRIHAGKGWETLESKSLLAKILRKFPKLQDVILQNAAPDQKKTVWVTSKRSYTEHQKQLERIMTVKIPENSKEIELARSYGDLRENAEFKYAKERQGLLMAQGSRLAEELEKVKPIDFANIITTEVSAGCGVEVVHEETGTVETYYILGIWDQDEALSIISSETRLAQALMGHECGDKVEIPTGKCVIKSIFPLPKEIEEWIAG